MCGWRGRESLVQWHHLIVIVVGVSGWGATQWLQYDEIDSIEVAVVGTPIVMGKVIKKTSQRS